ncbi:GntR family transcriptional regulator [Frankia sp. CpI1-P]|uniref:GntR family transcriptional regulator n=1 Tax=Frankia sp. CpI1-P TaxID=1502734 RepID=UPI0037C018DA
MLSRGTAPRDIADMLGVPADTQVVIRDRRMGPAGGQILHISTSYLPADLAAGTPLEAINTGPGGIYDRMEQDMGLRLSWVDYYAARMPTADEASILGVPISVPLLRIIRVTDDESGRVVEVNDTRMSSEKFMVARPLVRAAEA